MDTTTLITCRSCPCTFPDKRVNEHGRIKVFCDKCIAEDRRIRAAKNYRENWSQRAEYVKRKHAERRAKVFERLGGKCECCGESDQAFLTIDHINGDGADQRRKHTGQQNIYTWLVGNKFPPGFRILCANCNHGARLNAGICPHQNGSQTIAQASRGKRPEAPETLHERHDIVEPMPKGIADLSETFHDNPSWPFAQDRVQ